MCNIFNFYKNPESPFNRNRSLSCGSPLRNQVVYQEIYNFGQNTLVRSVSCNQVFSRNESGQTFETTQIQVSSFITPEKCKREESFKTIKKSNIKLDELSTVVKDHQSDLVSDPKNYILKARNAFKMKSMFNSVVLFGLSGVLFGLIIFFYFINLKCQKIWDINLTHSELQQKVYGQSEAIARIKLVLNEYNKTTDLRAMIFTGSVGVGKTYTSSIIYENFSWTSKKKLFLYDLNKEMYEKLLNDLSICGCDLIIFDDLTYQNVDETVQFLLELNLKKEKNRNILLILIFQIHTEAERNDILTKYKKLYLHYYHIPFQRLTEESVKQCFLKEIKKQKAVISESELEKLVKQKIKDVDTVKGPVGCKGIADEISEYL